MSDQYPLRPLRNDEDHKKALVELERLMELDLAEGPEADKLQLLGIIIEDYEKEHFPIPAPDKSQQESYPAHWKHCTIHLDPRNGEMHSDGDHSVREWIQERIAKIEEQVEKRDRTIAKMHDLLCRSKGHLKVIGAGKHAPLIREIDENLWEEPEEKSKKSVVPDLSDYEKKIIDRSMRRMDLSRPDHPFRQQTDDHEDRPEESM